MKNVFQENNTWAYKVKVIKNYEILFEVRGGFDDEKSAQEAYLKANKQYQEELARIKALTDIRFTFLEYLDYWYSTFVASCTESSIIATYKWTIERIIKPLCENDVLLGRITSTYVNNLVKKCADYSKTSEEMASKVINNALKTALSMNYINGNVLQGLNPVQRRKPEVPVLCTSEQVQKLLQGARTYNGGIHYFEIVLALFCGLRSGEIRGLRFSDFNAEEKTLSIRRQCTARYYTDASIKQILDEDNQTKEMKDGRTLAIKPPKSIRSCRKLRIPDFIFDELKCRKAMNDKIFEGLSVKNSVYKDFISISSKGELKAENTLRNALIHICARCAIPQTTVHGLRHMFATILLENGEDITLEEVSNIMGHKSVGTTFDIYCGIIQGREQIRDTIAQQIDPFHSFGR